MESERPDTRDAYVAALAEANGWDADTAEFMQWMHQHLRDNFYLFSGQRELIAVARAAWMESANRTAAIA